MRLCEHGDFEQAMLLAAEHHDVSEQFVEKDYYVTEILRIVASRLGKKAVFKGGTSLSKGWDLISRFSEDIDLFVNPSEFDPPLGRSAIDRTLKQLAAAVAEHPALTWLRDEGRTSTGRGRMDVFSYQPRFVALPGLRPTVLLEPGVRSGAFPTEVVPISSLVGAYLQERNSGDIADDLSSFEMALLHYRRTFVEKMFALHGKVMDLQAGGRSLGRDARHYSDLYALSVDPEVRSMLASDEYSDIRHDCDAKSREFFLDSYQPPVDLSFAESPALTRTRACANSSRRTTRSNAACSSRMMITRGSNPCWRASARFVTCCSRRRRSEHG